MAMLTTALLALLSATNTVQALNEICPSLPAKFTLGDSFDDIFSTASTGLPNSPYRAIVGTKPKAMTFFLNPVCDPGSPYNCGIQQLSFTTLDPVTCRETTYGAYAPTDGGDLIFLKNGSDTSGLSIIYGSNSYDEFEPGRCKQLYLMGYLNKYLSVPRICGGVLGLDRYYGNSAVGCEHINTTYTAL